MLSNPLLKSVCIIGPKEADFQRDIPSKQVTWVSAEDLQEGRLQICGENPPESGFCENRELHINSQTNERLKEVMAKVMVNSTNNSNSYQKD